MFKKYLSLRPKCDNLTPFYLRALNNPKEDCWYTSQPIGRVTLSKVMTNVLGQLPDEDSCGLAVKPKCTNHSLRVTTASGMFQNNCDEQLILDCTGHCSTAVRAYKRTSSKQLEDVSNILYGNIAEEVPCKRPKLETVTSDCLNVKEDTSKLSFNFTINLNK